MIRASDVDHRPYPNVGTFVSKLYICVAGILWAESPFMLWAEVAQSSAYVPSLAWA